MGDDRVVEDAAPVPSVAGDPAWQIRPDGLSGVNEFPSASHSIRSLALEAQGVPLALVSVELLQNRPLLGERNPRR